jgi:hypothetical protein
MSQEVYGMKGCPWEMKNIVFTHGEDDVASNLEITVRLSDEDYKHGKESYIDIDADQGMAYPLALSVKVEGEWHTIREASAIRVVIRGDYEKSALILALQRIALMTLPVYGKMKTSDELWEEQNAIREQT